ASGAWKPLSNTARQSDFGPGRATGGRKTAERGSSGELPPGGTGTTAGSGPRRCYCPGGLAEHGVARAGGGQQALHARVPDERKVSRLRRGCGAASGAIGAARPDGQDGEPGVMGGANALSPRAKPRRQGPQTPGCYRVARATGSGASAGRLAGSLEKRGGPLCLERPGLGTYRT